MLIGNESTEKGLDMQVTHSNFNYKVHGSDLLPKNSVSLKPYPGRINSKSEFIIYPHLVEGSYKAKLGNKVHNINNNEKILRIPLQKKYREIKILPNKSPLPSRFQLGLVSNINKQRIPNEVAFSSITGIEPLKRFHWGIVSAKFNSSILLTAFF